MMYAANRVNGLPDLVPEESTARVTVTGRLHHLCPHVDEVDSGTVEISWTCAGQTIELHSLADYLRDYAGERISHEQITHAIRTELAALYGIADVQVRTTWATAGLQVRAELTR